MILKMSKKMGYFFDLDGTLVDSSKCHSSAFNKVLAIHYPEICKNFNYENFKGKSTPSVFRDLGIIDPKKLNILVNEKRRIYLDYINNGKVPIFLGALRLLRILKKNKKTNYIVTSASRNATLNVLEVSGLITLVDDIITSENAKRNKPNPDLYLVAIEKSNIPVRDIVVVEDSLAGKIAANKAGIDVIMVNQSKDNNACLCFNTLNEFYLHIKKEFKV
jgi:beta-phosphoglucomutase|tara:strand:- start:458 stop:1114 length:657 start_codon:yes stop_codon:yes gene_type:complete